LVDYPVFSTYYSMKSYDMYLPRWKKNLQTGELLSFEEYMSPPVSRCWQMKGLLDAELQWIENTPEELEAATKEMLERTKSGPASTIPPDDDLQKRYKAMAENSSLNYGGRLSKPLASISRDFLERHADLLEE